MKIDEIHVDNFGIISGLDLAGLSRELTIFRGDNESGKTTLMNFVRQVLFGFPRKGSGILYPPDKGRGGRLTVTDDGGERYIIERIHKSKTPGDVSVILPDGSSGGEEVLSRLFPGTDRKLFENVFAFTIDELHRFDSLEDVKSALFSASMGLAPSVSLSEILGSFDESQRRIFNPKRKGGQLDKHLDEARVLQKEIEELAAETDKYDELVNQLEKKKAALSDLKTSVRMYSDDIDRNNTLLGAWGDYQLIKEWEAELQDIVPVDVFPEDGGSMLREKKQALREKQISLAQLMSDIEQEKKKTNELVVNDGAVKSSAVIRQLVERNKQYVEAEKDIPLVTKELTTQRENLMDLQSGLGPAWDDQKLMSFDISTDMKNRIKEFKENLTETHAELSSTTEALNGANKAKEEARARKEKVGIAFRAFKKPTPFEEQVVKEVINFKRRIKEAEDIVISRASNFDNAKKTLERIELKQEKANSALHALGKPAVSDENGISSGKRTIRIIRDYITGIAQERTSLGHEQRVLADKELEIGRTKSEVDPSTRWWGLAGAGLGLIFGIILVVTGQLVPGAVAGSVILILGLAFFFVQNRKLSLRQEESEMGEGQLAEQMKAARAAVDNLSNMIQEKSEKLATYAKPLDMGENITLEGLDRYEDFLETQKKLLLLWNQARERVEELDEEQQEARNQFETLSMENDKAEEELTAVRNDWKVFLGGAGLSDALDTDGAISEIEHLERSLIKWEDAKSRYEEVAEEYELACESTKRDQINFDDATKNELVVESAWKSWLTENGLSETFDPDEALMSVESIKSGRQILRETERLESRIATMERTVADYRTDAKRLFELCGYEEPDTDRYLEMVNRLNEELDLSKANLANREACENDIEKLDERRRLLEEEIKGVEQDINELFLQCGAESEDEFFSREIAFGHRKQLLEKIESNRSRIVRNVGGGESYERFVNELEKTSKEELDREKNRLQQVAEEVGFQNDELVKEITSIDEVIRRITSREDIETKRTLMESELSRAQDLAKEWDKLATASFFIRKAKRKYEEEKQPQVIKEAEDFFSAVTRGAYSGIYAPIGEEEIVLVKPNEERLTQDMLSRGTVEQLYLSLRYGYIRTGKRQYPVMADEVLINFDLERCSAALTGLLELSKSHQIFYFTCHPETIDIAKELTGDISVIEMVGGRATKVS